MKERTRLFAVTQKDFRFQPTKGSGPGGQHRNKNATAMRVTHVDSGAVGYAADDKSQAANKKNAWRKCVESDTFKRWIRRRIAEATGEEAKIEAAVTRQMRSENVLVEVRESDDWIPVEKASRRS